MAPYETVEEYTRKPDGYVEHVRIRQTEDDKYPSGWDYALHYGTTEGETLLRNDTVTMGSKKSTFRGCRNCSPGSNGKSTTSRRD